MRRLVLEVGAQCVATGFKWHAYWLIRLGVRLMNWSRHERISEVEIVERIGFVSRDNFDRPVGNLDETIDPTQGSSDGTSVTVHRIGTRKPKSN
jgi:hypothetical protein